MKRYCGSSCLRVVLVNMHSQLVQIFNMVQSSDCLASCSDSLTYSVLLIIKHDHQLGIQVVVGVYLLRSSAVLDCVECSDGSYSKYSPSF